MKVLKYLLRTLVALVVLFLAFLLYATIDNYNPDPVETIDTAENADVITDSTFSIVTWNLGYAGLDSTMDFFYDGGEKVRPEKEEVMRNIRQIMVQLETYRDHDFILLQEVDKRSKRSYRNNQYLMISALFNDYHTAFGKNYDVDFVPLPPTEPMGKVLSGLQTLSAYTPATVTRRSFPGNYSWPMSVFMLDRCFLVNRHPLPGGNELVVINTHNSAYDDGTLRQQQMDYLKAFLLEEVAAGNDVVAGGDWNQCPAGFEPEFAVDRFDTEDLIYIEADYPAPDWTWAYDPATPTNRRVMHPYTRGDSPTTVIDYFLLSPNVELLSVEGEYLEFAWSDHQPVIMHFKLK
ncbi:MAG: endonuclease/exonuclease/phosphatase family protein [Bacteroidales bacterium]|nr:endonuclease/exonuclease/phosphatase family protein [Bacteroidales bacterium]MDT8431020.1 endonuclease/exonuclease/phosphatase family protein [Bacteroidales bacterium]